MTAQTPTLQQRVDYMLQAGRLQDAQAVLRDAAASGDADAALALARFYLSGRPFGRDLRAARSYFERATELGSDAALTAVLAFRANGTGGERDWDGALNLLESTSDRIPHAKRELQLLRAMPNAGREPEVADGEPVTLLPGAKVFRGLLTAEECAFLIELASPLLRPSTVVHPQSGQMLRDPIRTSDAAAFPLIRERPFVHAVNRRIAVATGTKVGQGEPLQLLRYAPGQQYKRHFDALPPGQDQRIATCLIYLNDDYEGGETVFPEVGFAFRGRTGDAFVFRNTDETGRPDPLSAHLGSPVTAGTKYLASRWIRTNPISLELPR